MKKVEHLSQFPSNCYVAQFSGKTYEDAIKTAESSKINGDYYFLQSHYGKSKLSTILVSYIKKDEQ